MNNRLIKSNNAGGGGACTNTVDLYNPFPDGGGVALYQLNGDATDVSTNYDGTWVGTEAYTTGEFGQAGSFGVQSRIETSLHFNGTTAQGSSFSAWFKGSPDNPFYLVQAKTLNPSGTFLGYIVIGNATGDFTDESVYVVSRGSSTLAVAVREGHNAYLDNQWHHIVVTSTSTTKNIYIDGQNKAVVLKDGSASTNLEYKDLMIHSDSAFGGSGEIDQVRIFNRALRPYEVEALYTEEYCTPTIVPSEHFNTVLYTGNGTGQSIAGVGFQPDFTWIKNRTTTGYWHVLTDSVRGTNSQLFSNDTRAQDTKTTMITSFDSDGFSVGSDDSVNGVSSQNYVSWNFKAGGAAVTNTDGTITSQVSANTEAGFSVVKQVPNNTNQTYGHGLGVAPSVIISKNLNVAGAWGVYHKDLGTGKYLFLNTTAAVNPTVNANVYPVVNDTVFSGGSGGWNSTTGGENAYINYCFAEVEGFSSFGSYVGNGSTSGATIVTGFEPAMIIVKRTDSTGDWRIWDNKRSIENPRNEVLKPNTSEAEETNSPNAVIDFLENGFQPKSTHSSVNASGASYIYMAFAADPTAVEPTLEDSFNTVTYTGNGGTQSITGVGFQPDLVWTKGRTVAYDHGLVDSVRGTNSLLYPSVAEQETITSAAIQSFDSDGFTWGSNNKGNASGTNYVSWNWKGAEIPAINSNGSIPSVVSANPAAGFSIVSYTGKGVNGDTVGHGLSDVPNVVIWKNRSDARNWVVWHSGLTSIDYSLILNSTSAEVLDSRTNRPFGQPTDSVLVLGEDNETNFSANNFVAYCFAEVAGFSKFGSYTGTGAGVQNTINCGFAPRFVMIKRTNSTGGWRMYDNVRGLDKSIQAQTSDAEYDDTTNYLDFYANGFEFNNGVSYQSNPDINASGGTYIYMAFANQF